MKDLSDPFDLQRFITAQEPVYQDVIHELSSGKKTTHWIWFIFPQIKGLGSSALSQLYAIKSKEEAQNYLDHPLLGARLIECSKLVLSINGRSIQKILGSPDDLKLRSCMTLFASLQNSPTVFKEVLEKYYNGKMDPKTLAMLYEKSGEK